MLLIFICILFLLSRYDSKAAFSAILTVGTDRRRVYLSVETHNLVHRGLSGKIVQFHVSNVKKRTLFHL